MTTFGLISMMLAAVCIATPSNAEIDNWSGVSTTTITIGGIEYPCTIGNEERKSDIYFLKKAIKGDEEAREMFLQGQDSRMFFIGTTEPLWIKVTETSIEVIKP